MQGCGSSQTFDQRDGVCGVWNVCTARQWITGNRDAVAPTHHYWTDDALGLLRGCLAGGETLTHQGCDGTCASFAHDGPCR